MPAPVVSIPRPKLGWIPSLTEARPPLIGAIISTAKMLASAPDEYLDMENDISYIRNQAFNSCVAHALCGITELRAKRQGFSLPQLATLPIYTGGRQLGGNTELTDNGSRASDLITFMSTEGCVTEDRWPERNPDGTPTANVSKPNPLDVFQHGVDAKVQDYFWVNGQGQNLVDSLVATLWNDLPVAFSGPADDAMVNCDSPEALDLPVGTNHGGHMTSMHGYARDASDPYGYRFRCRNSWGRGWGDNGFFWATGRRVVMLYAEFVAVRVAPQQVSP